VSSLSILSQRALSAGDVSSRAGKSLLMALALVVLTFLSACSSSTSASGVGCPGGAGTFTNLGLPAGSQWAYNLSGTISQSNGVNSYTEAGVFTADGNGNISSGMDDYYGSSFSGKYSISSNGTGSITVVLANGAQTLSWGITLSSTSPGSFYLIEADSFANAAGTAMQQTASALGTMPRGTFVFHTHVATTGLTLAGSMATVGTMTVSNGSFTGREDVLLGGQLASQLTLSGSLTAPDSTGRGGATLIDSSGRTQNYKYYVIDTNTLQLYEIDSGIVGLGRAEMQTGAPFTTNSLSAGAGFASGSRGDTTASVAANGVAGGVNTVGAMTFDGAGNISAGSFDSVRDGTVNSNLSVTGTYSADVSGDGRYTFTLNSAAGTVTEVAYMVSPSRAFFLVNDSTKVEDGTADQQSNPSFATSDFNGQFALVMGGYDATNFVDRTGVLEADGKGGLSLAELLNRTGVVTVPGCLPGTYSVASNGRVSGSVSTLSPNLVFYMVSGGAGGKAYVLEADTLTQISGGMAEQTTAVVDPPGIF
jgi:hypothetical protein